MNRTVIGAVALGLFAACGQGEVSANERAKQGHLAQAVTSCGSGPTVQGIDVSSVQGDVNWQQVAASGRAFAFIKATEGTGYVNPTFANGWAGSKAAGVLRGAYHFFHPGEDPIAQANFFVQTMGPLEAGDLPPMIDWEVTDGSSNGADAAAGAAFLARVQQLTGRVPILYTYPGFWYGLGAPSGFAQYPLFIADYGVSCTDLPPPWGRWQLWQDGSTGNVPGVGGQVDTDVFQGSLDDLRAFAQSSAAPPAIPPTTKTGIAARPGGGYWLVQADGGVFSYGGAPFFGSMGGKTLNAPVVGIAAAPDCQGYWLVAQDGGVFGFGSAGFFGSTGAMRLAAPMVGIAATPTGKGYWLVGADGGVFSFGDAGFFGSTGGKALNAPVVGIAAAPDGRGYWLVAADGGIFNFGSAGFFGSMGSTKLAAPVVGVAATATGKGYWLVGADGGVFNFGDAAFQGSLGGQKLSSAVTGIAPEGEGYLIVEADGTVSTLEPAPAGGTGSGSGSAGGGSGTGNAPAPFYGSMGGKPLAAPVVGMAARRDGAGYWLVAADGGVFNFGAAGFFGSMGGKTLNAPVVGLAATPSGNGYWLVAADGGIFSFGDARYFGSMGGTKLNAPIAAMAAAPDGAGYWLVGADGGVFSFGDAGFFGSAA